MTINRAKRVKRVRKFKVRIETGVIDELLGIFRWFDCEIKGGEMIAESVLGQHRRRTLSYFY